MKRQFWLILVLTFFVSSYSFGQATKSYPFAVGQTGSCGGGTHQVHFYNYNGTTNIISNASGGMVNSCVPQLRYGASNNQIFTAGMASISFNPKDHNIYYFPIVRSGAGWKTYAYNWPLGSCPGTTSNRMPPIQVFNTFIMGIAFDNEGNGYSIEFTDNAPYKGMIRSIDFSTGTFGAADTLQLTAGKTIIQPAGGDVVMTPSGQMFFVVDNRLYTPDYKSYVGAGAKLTCTYIDTVIAPTSATYVGLTYADGEMIAAYSGSGCPFYETNMVTAATSSITKSGSVTKANDLATVISGIGAAKNLVSVTPTGTAKQYTVVYDVYVKNYGNMDVSNVQVTDDLKTINGNGNVTFVSKAFISNPAGMVLNPSYDGKTNINLLNGTGTLKNFPVAQNNFTIRITCTLSNIEPGVIYNNSAIVTAKDFNNNSLRDVSTNGTDPDLNSNDKPDDAGEDQPTPLLIAVTPISAPCEVLGQVIYKQDFGTGTTNTVAFPKIGIYNPTSTYGGSLTAPVIAEKYMVANNANKGDLAKWINLTDHTGNTNGKMLLVNADAKPNVIYSDMVNTTGCGNQQYSFFFYGAFIGNSDYKTICDGFGGFKYPKVRLRVKDYFTGVIIAQTTTIDITSSSWQQYGMKFLMPPNFPYVIIELSNEGAGGCGNDLAIDDIQFGICSPAPVVSIGATAAGCLGSASIFNSTISDPSAFQGAAEYQWQISPNDVTWTNITGATNAVFTIANTTSSDVAKYYRVIVAGPGNMTSLTCRYVSPGVLLPAKTQSVAPTAARTSHAKVCPGKKITLSTQGGTLGTGAVYRWYSGSCGGTLVGTGASITVTPNVTTTYFVRAEGDCNITICRQVTVTISCDIDKDKDGIPDWVESNMPAAFGEHDGDGIINAYDEDYPGFVDNNGDFINDWFQADGDVDGDGIPNYLDTNFPGRIDTNGDGIDDRFDADLDGIINMLDLDSDNDGIPDVVEAGGVDANGDGKLDNFVDSDGDGLSDQVDANPGGAYNSGVGLGLKDTDGDGVPNQFDLDSDNDGIPDVREVGGTDANNDGRIDGFIDANHDGISDHIVGANALLRTGPDNNHDGRADSYPYHNMDKDGVPNPYDLDSDGDGIVDVVEAGLPDANYDGRVDGAIGANGWSTTVSSMSTLTLRNSDGDPNPDYLDIDSDNDGIPDIIEGPATAQFKFPTGVDTDGDGIDNAFDSHPSTWGGYGNFPIDTDGDYIPDYLDADSDGDGVTDIKEGHDYNFNGHFDEITTLTGIDTDGDGLDDRFDLDNTSAKGTSSNLGNGGTTAGDPNPGTTAVVQQTPPGATNRDWRYMDYVLEVTSLSFNGHYIGIATLLNWTIQCPEEIISFEVLRSTDNLHFESAGKLEINVAANQLRKFNHQDDLMRVNAENIFYKLQIKSVSGKLRMSDVIRINTGSAESSVLIKPNPANHFATINFTSLTGGNSLVRISDNTGKVVKTQSQILLKGRNIIELTNLSQLSNGVYTVQIIANGDAVNIKLVIAR